MGWRKPQVTRPPDSPSSLSVGLPCPAAGARSTWHTHPPPHANRRTAALWGRKVCNCALTQCPEPPPPRRPWGARDIRTGTAVSPSHQRLGEVQGLPAVWAAVRPDNRRRVPSRAGEVRIHYTGRGTPPLAEAVTQPNPTPAHTQVRVRVRIRVSICISDWSLCCPDPLF